MAAPRVALFAAGASPAELRVARVTLESAQLEVEIVDAAALPYAGGVEAVGVARAEATRAVADMRALFLATHFSEARKVALAAERRVVDWRGVPAIAQALAELALMSGQCGDPQGFARAVARHPVAELAHASWSPEVRAAYGKELAADRRRRQSTLFIDAPPDAAVFVDGIARGTGTIELSATVGEHALYVTRQGQLPFTARVEVDAPTRVSVTLHAAPPDALPGLARLRILDGELPTDEESAASARQLDVDALVTLNTSPAIELGMTGPGIPPARFTGRGDRLAAIELAAKQAGAHFRARCMLSHTPPERARAATALTLLVGTAACVARVDVRYRVSRGAWQRVGATAGATDGVSVVIPGASLPSADRSTLMEYTVGAFGHGERLIAALGDPSAPLRLTIDPDRRPPRWYHKWWVWTLVGVVAAGAVITPAVLLTRPASDARLIGAP